MVKSAVLIVALLTIFAYMTLIERRVLARFQRRVGPNRAGPFGLLQPLADGIKMAFKEQIIPTRSRRLVFLIAPAISVFIAISAFAVVPLGSVDHLGQRGHREGVGAVRRGHQRRRAVYPGDLVAGRLWHRAGRLGIGESLFAAGRAAVGGADGLV